MSDLIDRQAAIDALDFEIVHMTAYCDGKNEGNPLAQYNKGLEDGKKAIEALPSAQPEERTETHAETHACDSISRQAAIDAAESAYVRGVFPTPFIREVPPAQPERRYTEEELKVFKHGISLSLLSKRSSQHWCYDEDTATEIKFLEQLYEKVSADMRGETA